MTSAVQKALVQRAVPVRIFPVCKLRLRVVMRGPSPESACDRVIDGLGSELAAPVVSEVAAPATP